MSAEETACSAHLQTAILFKTLTERFRELNSKSSILHTNKELLDHYVKQFNDSIKGIESLCTNYEVDSSGIEITQSYITSLHANLENTITERDSSIEQELVDLTGKLNSIRSLIAVGIEDIVGRDTPTKKLCPVCFDREVDLALVPCGHTYCSGCAEYDKHTKCPQCRSVVTSKIKLYFSM